MNYFTSLTHLKEKSSVPAKKMESMCEIQTNERETQQKEHKHLMLDPINLQTFTLASVRRCVHISCLTSNRFWVNYRNNLILSNTMGDIIDNLKDAYSGYGIHTVKKNNELIYINKDYDIKRKTLMTTKIFKKKDDSEWTPECVYWSNSNGNLLVGMYAKDASKGKVTRYNQTAQLIKTIQHDKKGMGLYKKPNYITENNNGDVVVSDYDSRAVVVTERGGSHRFSYKGHPAGSELEPWGICTDKMSHIFVCDNVTKSVQILDKEGRFILKLLTNLHGLDKPRSLGYNNNTKELYVGSFNNNDVSVFKFKLLGSQS